MSAVKLRPPKPRREASAPYLAILLEKGAAGFARVHAGLGKYGFGRTFCSDRLLPEFGIPAEDPNFALSRSDGWRHRYAEAFLEVNRGCPGCLEVLYQISKDVGWAQPKSLDRL